jgi:hypothetical protein
MASTLKFIGKSFPSSWLWGRYESNCIRDIKQQINDRYLDQHNLLINLTWFGPQFANGLWNQLQTLNQKFDNLFLLSTVDPPMINPEQIADIVQKLGNPKLFKIGNFDTNYHFNFFAPLLAENFATYDQSELLLTECKYVYINYNRKPRQHRVAFVQQLLKNDLVKHGVVTIGRSNVVYDKDPNNQLFLTIGEEPNDYRQHGHWFASGSDEFGIPHDVLSLHNMKYWKYHFLNVIGATEFNEWDDIFVSETQFKPIIGLRPFVINGNTRTYGWLRDNGFRTFNHYWPKFDLENSNTVHAELIGLIQHLSAMPFPHLVELYNQMLPDLEHNQKRFWDYAKEQQFKMHHILC